MDMMTIRKMVMGQMAKGKDFVSGTFTTPDSDTLCTIEFGKTFNRYLFYIEATEISKSTIMTSGETAYKAFAFFGIYPNPSIGNFTVSNPIEAFRINPSNDMIFVANTTAIIAYNDRITNNVRGISTANPNYFYKGLSYNYTIVSLD